MSSVKIPKIGMRIIKSSVAVALCYVVQLFRGDDGIVFYSQLSALWCMQSYISTTKKNAIQRTVGTVIGAFFGLVLLLAFSFIKTKFNFFSDVFDYSLHGFLVSVCLIPILYLTVLLKKKQASYFSCVVFLSIVVNHVSDDNPYLFALSRFLDTMIGIGVGVGVNLFHLPRKKNTDILFLSGLDETLLNENYKLNDYCKVELNRMLDDGLKFTFSSMRTPASLLEVISDINIRIPAICMDGAVLFDTKRNHYLEKIELTADESQKVLRLVKQNSLVCFSNLIIDDTLLIFYDDLNDETQIKMLDKLRFSPYRNYIKRPVPDNIPVVYFMLFYPDSVIDDFYKVLERENIVKEMKVLKYKSKDYYGYSYIKIYNKFATKDNMIELLKRRLGVFRTVTFGTIKNHYDYVVNEGDTNQVVHTLKKLFER